MLHRLELCGRPGYKKIDYRITGNCLKKPIVWCSARQATVTHSPTEAEYIAVDTGSNTLTWIEYPAKEIRIPVVNRPASLRIDDKPATKYHEGNIIVDTRQDLLMLTDN